MATVLGRTVQAGGAVENRGEAKIVVHRKSGSISITYASFAE